MVEYYCSAVCPPGDVFLHTGIASYPLITKSHNTSKVGFPWQLVLPRQRHMTDVNCMHISISVNGLLVAVCVLAKGWKYMEFMWIIVGVSVHLFSERKEKCSNVAMCARLCVHECEKREWSCPPDVFQVWKTLPYKEVASSITARWCGWMDECVWRQGGMDMQAE